MSGYDGEVRILTRIDNKEVNSQMMQLENRMEKTARKAQDLEAEMRKMEQAQVPTEEYKDVSDALHKSNTEFDKLLARQESMIAKGQTSGTTWDSIQRKMEDAGADIRASEKYLSQMVQEGTAYQNMKETDKYKKYADQLRDCNNQMDVLQKKHDELADKQLSKVSKAAKKTSGLFSTLLSRLKGITLSLLIFNWITKGFNAMISAFKTGVQNMAKYSSDFNAKMSQMQSATELLKASLGALSAPIVSALTPAIVTLCGWLTNAINAINKFISAVSGKSTWTRAKKQQKDYAGSLKDTASAAKQAAGALAAFDDLNVLQKNDTSGSGGSSGGSTSPEYEEVALTEDDFKWINTVKKALQGLLPIVLAIGAAFLTWKVYDLISGLKAMSPLLGGIAGTIAIIAGTALAVVSYFHMWEKGVDWKGLIGYITGVSIAAGGVLALFGPLAAGIVIMVASIAGLVLALKDIVEHGANAKNVALALVSAIGLVAGVFMAFGAPAAVVVGAIVAIVAAMILFGKKSDEVKKTVKSLWEDHFKPFGDNIKAGIAAIQNIFLAFWNAYIKPILDAIGKKWEELVTGHIQPMVTQILKLIGSIIDLVSALWKNLLVPFIAFLIAYIIPTVAPIIQTVTSLVFGMAKAIADIITGIIAIFTGFIDVITGLINGDWRKVCQGMAEILQGTWLVIKAIINAILGGVEVMANGVVNAANTIIDSFNGLHFNIPDWVPKIGGKNFGFNIAHVHAVNVPRLGYGGIAIGSTYANLGEAGREAVLPLENHTEWMDDLAYKIASKMPTGRTPSTLILEMNGKQVARAQLPYIQAEQQRLGVTVVSS